MAALTKEDSEEATQHTSVHPICANYICLKMNKQIMLTLSCRVFSMQAVDFVVSFHVYFSCTRRHRQGILLHIIYLQTVAICY